MNGKRMNAVMIGEEDIAAMTAAWEGVPAWLKMHLAARRPAHRYEGQLETDGEGLIFCGRDMKEGRAFEIEMPLAKMTGVSLGFAEAMDYGVDPVFGNGGPVPFAVHYDEDGANRTAYFNVVSDNYAPHISADNRRWYEMLDEALEQRADAGRRRELVAV
jgi:hypothetical protein